MTNFRTLDTNITPYALALTEGFGDFVDDSCLGIYMPGVDLSTLTDQRGGPVHHGGHGDAARGQAHTGDQRRAAVGGGAMTLKWSDPDPERRVSHYDHVIAETPLGRILIEWKSWKKYNSPVATLPWGELVYGGDLDPTSQTITASRWRRRTSRSRTPRRRACWTTSPGPSGPPPAASCGNTSSTYAT